MKVLVLGGTYFIGAAITSELIARGHDVAVANRGTRPPPVGARHIRLDRSDAHSFSPGQARAYDVVLDVSAYKRSDMDASRGLIEGRPARYVLISSAAVYDRRIASVPFREDALSSGDPIWGNYGVDKAGCEAWLAEVFPGAEVIIRPPYVCGPGNQEERESFIFARLLSGRPVLLPGEGQTAVQFCDVGDLAKFAVDCAEGLVPIGVYNIGEPRAYTLREWICELASVAGVAPLLKGIDPAFRARDYFPFRDADLVLDVSRWMAVANRQPTSLRQSMEAALEWLRREDRLQVKLTPLETGLSTT